MPAQNCRPLSTLQRFNHHIARLAVGSGGKARSLSAADAADTRCFSVFAVLAAGKDEEMVDLGKIGVFYFHGKPVVRIPTLDLEATVRSVAPSVQANSTTETARCLAEVQAAAQVLSTVGDALQK